MKYPFAIRASGIQGLGAFATEFIPAGTRLVEYAGERLTTAEACNEDSGSSSLRRIRL